jgi:Uma2 family endonuclease
MLDHIRSRPRFTYGDYRRWAGDERWELIGGEALAMSPSPSRRHQDLLVGLLTRIAAALGDSRCRVYPAPFDVRLPASGEAGDEVTTVVQPDLSVICDPSKLDEAGCVGAPDWVIEILSPATAARDRVQKREIYERHGVTEYWVVDPEAKTVTVYRRRGSDPGHFGEPEVHGAPDAYLTTPLSGLQLTGSEIFGPHVGS